MFGLVCAGDAALSMGECLREPPTTGPDGPGKAIRERKLPPRPLFQNERCALVYLHHYDSSKPRRARLRGINDMWNKPLHHTQCLWRADLCGGGPWLYGPLDVLGPGDHDFKGEICILPLSPFPGVLPCPRKEMAFCRSETPKFLEGRIAQKQVVFAAAGFLAVEEMPADLYNKRLFPSAAPQMKQV